jgi:hypothetical protein
VATKPGRIAGIDEHHRAHACRPARRKRQCDGAPEVHRHHVGARHAQHGERAIEIVRLRAHAVIRVECPIGFAPAEQVGRERRDAAERQRGGDVAPEKGRRSEPVEQHHGPVAEPVSLDVKRAWSYRNLHACNLSS